MLHTSSVVQPSESRRVTTSRWLGGSEAIAGVKPIEAPPHPQPRVLYHVLSNCTVPYVHVCQAKHDTVMPVNQFHEGLLIPGPQQLNEAGVVVYSRQAGSAV